MFSNIPAHGSWSVVRTRALPALVMVVVLVAAVGSLNAGQPVIVQHSTTQTNKTFIGGDGYWDVNSNWSPQGEPQDGDHVIIPDDTVCRVRTSDARADSFEVKAGGRLLIHNQLTIDNDSQVVDPWGVELVREHPNDPEVPTLVIDGDVILSGTGSICGEEDDAQIKIRRYRSLVNKACIEGVLHILDPDQSTGMFDRGTLINAGEIIADGDGELVIESTISLTSQPMDPGEWIVDGTDATLILNACAAPLSDSFVIYSGLLRVSALIVTSGNLTQDGGTLDVEADLTLHHPNYPLSKSRYTFNGGSGNVACDVTFSYDDFTGTQENPDNTQDEDPPYEVVGPPCGG